MLLESAGLMNHVELLAGILASIHKDGLFASWMVGQEASDINDLLVNNNPVRKRRLLRELTSNRLSCCA